MAIAFLPCVQPPGTLHTSLCTSVTKLLSDSCDRLRAKSCSRFAHTQKLSELSDQMPLLAKALGCSHKRAKTSKSNLSPLKPIRGNDYVLQIPPDLRFIPARQEYHHQLCATGAGL